MLSAAGGHAVPPAAVWGGVTHRDAVEVCPHSMLTAPRRREPAVCPQYGVCSRGRKPRGVPASRPVAVRPHAPGTGLQPARTPSSGHRTWGVTRRASVCIRLPRPAPWVPVRSMHRVSSSRERVYLEGGVHLLEAERLSSAWEASMRRPRCRPRRDSARPFTRQRQRGGREAFGDGLRSRGSFAFLAHGRFCHRWVLGLVRSCGFCPSVIAVVLTSAGLQVPNQPCIPGRAPPAPSSLHVAGFGRLICFLFCFGFFAAVFKR